MLHLNKDFTKYTYLSDVITSPSFFTEQTKGFETTLVSCIYCTHDTIKGKKGKHD